MGLDMYLNGVEENGTAKELGYWRKHPNLPSTSGFFFGESQPEDRKDTIKILTKAIKWLSEDGFTRTVYYQASW